MLTNDVGLMFLLDPVAEKLPMKWNVHQEDAVMILALETNAPLQFPNATSQNVSSFLFICFFF